MNKNLWCSEWDSNPHSEELDPKSSASANSAIRAKECFDFWTGQSIAPVVNKRRYDMKIIKLMSSFPLDTPGLSCFQPTKASLRGPFVSLSLIKK